jgi:hypothetical protein
MDKRMLELQSDRIEGALESFKVPARVTGGVVTPRVVRYDLAPAIGVRVNELLGLAGELASALGVGDVRMMRQGGGVQLEVRRDDAEPIKLLPLLKWLGEDRQPIPPVTATLGICDDGAPLLIRLSSPDVGHVLIGGPSGCGKSALLRTMALSLAATNAPRDLRLVLIGRELDGLRLPHVLNREVACLSDLIGQQKIVVLVDDLEYGGALASLLKDGHKRGVYIVASGNIASAGFSTLITGQGERGDFEATANGERIRFRSAFITPQEIGQVVGALGVGDGQAAVVAGAMGEVRGEGGGIGGAG